MFDPKAYREDCAQLRLGQETMEEMISMTKQQNDKRSVGRSARVLVLAAAVAAALGVTAFAASDVGQEFFTAVTYSFTMGESGVELGVRLPAISLEEREGRSILSVDGQETDITDDLAQGGYCRKDPDGAWALEVDQEGCVHVTAYDRRGNEVLSYTTVPVDGQEVQTGGQGEDAQSFFVTEDGQGGMTVTAAGGQAVDVEDGGQGAD